MGGLRGESTLSPPRVSASNRVVISLHIGLPTLHVLCKICRMCVSEVIMISGVGFTGALYEQTIDILLRENRLQGITFFHLWSLCFEDGHGVKLNFVQAAHSKHSGRDLLSV